MSYIAFDNKNRLKNANSKTKNNGGHIRPKPYIALWTFGLFHIWKKTEDFSKNIAASELKIGRNRHLIEFMKVCEY